MQHEARSLNGLMPRATRSLATAKQFHFRNNANFRQKTHQRALHSETLMDDARTLTLSHFQRATNLAIWQLPAIPPPKPRLLDQVGQKILRKHVTRASIVEPVSMICALPD